MKKIILHLCADTGSDTKPYQDSDEYEVILVGSDIGVENYTPPPNVHGVFANPVCTEFSTAKGFDKTGDLDKGMDMVNHCLRIINECKPVFWVVENPAKGRLKEFLGKPKFVYQPWQYGSPWTKQTALWGNFKIPLPLYIKWEQVPKNENLYIRPNRKKPSLAFMHAKAHMKFIKEFEPFMESILKLPARIKGGGGGDMAFRSLCSQGFAKEFFKANQ